MSEHYTEMQLRMVTQGLSFYFHLRYQRDPVGDIGDLTTHVCVYAPHLISQTERKTLPNFAI